MREVLAPGHSLPAASLPGPRTAHGVALGAGGVVEVDGPGGVGIDPPTGLVARGRAQAGLGVAGGASLLFEGGRLRGVGGQRLTTAEGVGQLSAGLGHAALADPGEDRDSPRRIHVRLVAVDAPEEQIPQGLAPFEIATSAGAVGGAARSAAPPVASGLRSAPRNTLPFRTLPSSSSCTPRATTLLASRFSASCIWRRAAPRSFCSKASRARLSCTAATSGSSRSASSRAALASG